MTNKEISRQFKLLAQILELHSENPFKIKSYTSAIFNIDKAAGSLYNMDIDMLQATPGIGKSIAAKIIELQQTGSIAELTEWLAKTPEGVIQILKIKGLGPKKVITIWQEMGIESPVELYYACLENRLVEFKGFGQKTQDELIANIEFLMENSGKWHYARAEKVAITIEVVLNEAKIPTWQWAEAYSRKMEIVDDLALCILDTEMDSVKAVLNNFAAFVETHEAFDLWQCNAGIFLKIYTATEANFVHKAFTLGADEKHLAKINFESIVAQNFIDEKAIYKALNWPHIIPELREGMFESATLSENYAEELITFKDIKGALHNHSTYSDGTHTVVEMANASKALGFEYFGIADHSQTAVYAKGLPPEKVLKQLAEIDKINAQNTTAYIFKGIESDILTDGSLDYAADIMAQFDYVVASIHSGFKMDIDKATARIIKAVENPFTTILGHPTGRLLLGRKGYDIDHKKIIDACAANGVAMELNANMYRLDLDWRYIPYCLEKGVKISINPDAHHTDGLTDINYGVNVARKGLLTKADTLNAMNLNEIKEYFEKKKG